MNTLRSTLFLTGALLIAGAFVTQATAVPQGPTRRTIAGADVRYRLTVIADAFAPLIAPQPQSGASAIGSPAVGEQILVLCSTIGPTDPQATFILGSNKIFATIGTPVGTLHVARIDDGLVTFDDGSTIAESNCAVPQSTTGLGLPYPQATLQPGSTGTQPIIVPPPAPTASPLTSTPPVAPAAIPTSTPHLLFNPYGTAQPQPSLPPVIILRSTPKP